MKKTIVKRIITTILAVATVGSTAALFAGCEEKSPEEKAKDAISDVYNRYKSLSEESSEEKETVELNLLDKIVSDKLYTVKFNAKKNDEKIYIRLNDAIDIDGYTVELQNKKDEFDSGWKEWDIKKDGEKLASFKMERDRYNNEITNNKMVVSISTYAPTSKENSEVEFKFTESRRDNIEIDVPAELTPDECKQHIDELKAMAWEEFKDDLTNYDIKNRKSDGVYYFPDDYDFPGDLKKTAHLLFVYSFKKDNRDFHKYGVALRPFIIDGELKFLNSRTASFSVRDDDLSQATKIG